MECIAVSNETPVQNILLNMNANAFGISKDHYIVDVSGTNAKEPTRTCAEHQFYLSYSAVCERFSVILRRMASGVSPNLELPLLLIKDFLAVWVEPQASLEYWQVVAHRWLYFVAYLIKVLKIIIVL